MGSADSAGGTDSFSVSCANTMARLSCAVVDAAVVASGVASSLAPSSLQSTAAPRVALILHGLMGSHRNWLHFSRRLVRLHPNWRFVLVDLPGHGPRNGASHSMSSRPATLYAAAKDLHDTVKGCAEIFPGGWRGVHATVGHSMGGRVLLKLLESFGQELHGSQDAREGAPLRVATLDTMPGVFNYASHDLDKDGAARVLSFVHSLPLSIPSRPWLQGQCTQAGFSPGMAQWMGTNLEPCVDSPGGLRFSFDTGAVQQMLDSHQSSSQWGVLQAPPPGADVHAVLARDSSRWQRQDMRAALESMAGASPSGAHLHWLEGGHWLHVDNPGGLTHWLTTHILR
jgi:pimeloyl-ACP methyl ester carboxylesterase